MHWSGRPTPPTSTTAPSGAERGDPAAHEGDHRPRPPSAAASAAVDAGPGRRRARRGRSPGRARRRRRPAGARSVSRRIRVTMAPTWALSARPLPVTAALTSLGVCSATGTPAGRAASDRDRAGLGGAHHGADVVLAEDPLDRDGVGPVLGEPRLERALDGEQPGARCRRRPACGPRRRRPASAAGRRRPRRRRGRSGSAPGRRRARAPSYLLVGLCWQRGPPSEHLFGTKLPAPSPTTRHRRARQRQLAGSPASTT